MPKLQTTKTRPRQWLEAKRFHSDDACLIYPFALGTGGYGIVTLGGTGKTVPAHRLMCGIAHGPSPSAQHEAAHKCGNPSCVNPKHLRWATPKENMADCVDHGTDPVGEKGSAAKLSLAGVALIRASSASQQELADAFGVSTRTIRNVKSGRTWSPDRDCGVERKVAHRDRVRRETLAAR